jgi:hypothetical protein
MDWRNRYWNAVTLRPLSWRVAELQTTFKNWRERFEAIAKSRTLKIDRIKIDRIKIERLRTIAFALFSIILGVWAYQTCCEETSLEWQKRHFPGPAVWKTGLQSEGYLWLQKQEQLSRALKNLPSRLDTGNKAWQSSGTKGQPVWWAIYGVAGDSSDPLIFCVKCSDPPKTWEPVGEGWSGFEAVIAKAHDQSHLYPLETKEKKAVVGRQEFFDPREIRY